MWSSWGHSLQRFAAFPVPLRDQVAIEVTIPEGADPSR